MSPSDRRKFFRQLWNIKGVDKQLLKASEELAELSLVILQYVNKSKDGSVDLEKLEDNINEEFGDVLNMLEQLELNFKVIDIQKVENTRMSKLKKLKARFF